MQDLLFWLLLCLSLAAMAMAEFGVLSANRPARAVPAQARRPAARPLTVLVVEPHDAFRKALCLLVQQCGHRPVPATDRASALALAQRQPPDLVLLDQDLPGSDAVGTATVLRARGSAAVIVLLSADAGTGLVVRSGVAAIDGWLPKPVPQEALVSLLGSTRQAPTAAIDEAPPLRRRQSS